MKRLTKKEKNLLKRMLIVYKIEMEHRTPQWASEYLKSLWKESTKEAEELVKKLTEIN